MLRDNEDALARSTHALMIEATRVAELAQVVEPPDAEAALRAVSKALNALALLLESVDRRSRCPFDLFNWRKPLRVGGLRRNA